MAYHSNNEKSEAEKIDFNKVLWKAVDHMNDSVYNSDMSKFAASLQALEILLIPKIKKSKIYNEEYNKIDKIYNDDISRAGNNMQKRGMATYNKLISWSKLIMIIITEAGYMPEERGSYGRREQSEAEEETEV